MEVIQVKNPRTFLIPAVQDLVTKVADSNRHIPPENSGIISRDILHMTTDDNAFIFLGEEGGKFKLMILGFIPTLALFPHPTIVAFYNVGSRELRDLGKMKLMDFIQERGYNSAWAVNASGRSDAAWLKVFGQGAVDIERIGTVFDFKVI